MIINNSNLNSINDSADFWYHQIGVNVITADTKNKKTYENWLPWQDKPISEEEHELPKKNGEYNKGIAIIPGPIWRGPYKSKYLVAIDLDNQKAIEEFCRDGLEELKQKTLVEQTSNLEKMHIYFIVEREIPNKASDKCNTEILKKINANEIPALEVKSNGKGIMFCANSPHQKDGNYRIIGTLKPEVFPASMVEERISLVCKKYNIPYGFCNNGNNINYNFNIGPSIQELFTPGTKILEGHNRHEAVLRIMESLLQRNIGIFSLEKIKQLAYEWNQEFCVPPLDDYEFNRQWNYALKFVGRNINRNSGESGDIGGINNRINNGKSHVSAAEIIVELVLERSTLFKDEFGIPHALLKENNHNEVLSIEGNKFESYVSKVYYDNCDKKTANAETINNAIRTIKAKSIFEGQTIPLHLKVAWANETNKDEIYYDLSDEKRRCIKITKSSGWKIMNNQIEVLFKRYGHQAPQVEPVHDYDSKIFDKFIDSLNIKNQRHKLLAKIWIISLLIPNIAHPILLPYGEKGSAKSTLQKKIKMLIDPSPLDLFSIYNDKAQFIQQIAHNYLCFYDNVKREPRWLSDEACRAVSGGAFSKRKNYTDDDDIPYKYKKILSFSGINVIFSEPDALDRSIKIELERIKDEDNIPDTKIEEALKQQIPALLGYIFDMLSKALDNKDFIKLSRLPRMADFAEWGEAIARAIGYKPLEFMDAYFENIGEQNIEIIEAIPFADAISKFIDYEMTSWISSPQSLINHLKVFADDNNIDSSKFPKNSQAISRRLKKIKSNLRDGLGIEVIVDRITSGKGNKKQLNTAIIKIRKIPPVSPISPVSKNDEGNEGKNIRDIEKNWR